MTVIGFDIQKGYLRLSILEGTIRNPTLIEKQRKIVISTTSTPQLLDWFESTFEEIINKHSPSKIGYRLTLAPKKDQIHYLSFPYAILNLLCYKKNIPLSEFTTLNFTPSKFDLPKGSNLYDFCDDIFGVKPPHWDNHQKNSLIAGWLLLEEQTNASTI